MRKAEGKEKGMSRTGKSIEAGSALVVEGLREVNREQLLMVMGFMGEAMNMLWN